MLDETSEGHFGVVGDSRVCGTKRIDGRLGQGQMSDRFREKVMPIPLYGN